MDWLLDVLGRFIGSTWTWLKGLGPLLQGVFGGVGATILWEGVIKPRREERSLARVLYEEIAFNAESAFRTREFMDRQPASLGVDFVLSDTVFVSLSARIGELRDLTAALVVFYQNLQSLRQSCASYYETVDQISELKSRQPAVQSITDARYSGLAWSLKNATTGAEMALKGVRNSLESLEARAEQLRVPLTKRQAPRWRRLFVKSKPFFSRDAALKDVEAMVERFKARIKSST